MRPRVSVPPPRAPILVRLRLSRRQGSDRRQCSATSLVSKRGAARLSAYCRTRNLQPSADMAESWRRQSGRPMEENRMMKMILSLGFAAGLVVFASQAHASASDICAGGYTYLKGPQSAWPAWAKSDICVRPWSDSSNPAATETPATVAPRHSRVRSNNF